MRLSVNCRIIYANGQCYVQNEWIFIEITSPSEIDFLHFVAILQVSVAQHLESAPQSPSVVHSPSHLLLFFIFWILGQYPGLPRGKKSRNHQCRQKLLADRS